MGETGAEMLAWHDIASAWASGWLREDAGRDKEIAALMRTPNDTQTPPLIDR
jgi:hypothetical protein